MLPSIGIGLTAASLLIDIIGLAIPFWIYKSASKTILGTKVTSKTYQGLWLICQSVSGGGQSSTICSTIPDEIIVSAYKAARAMEILGMLIIIGALACVLLKQFGMKEQALLPKIGAICAIVAGVLMIIGTIIFGTMDWVDSSKLHAGFALCIISGVIGIAAGIVIFLGSKSE